VAVIGVGVWLWMARNSRLSAPTLAIGHSGGVVGWAGEV